MLQIYIQRLLNRNYEILNQHITNVSPKKRKNKEQIYKLNINIFIFKNSMKVNRAMNITLNTLYD